MDNILIKNVITIAFRVLVLTSLAISSSIASTPKIEIELYPSRVPKVKTIGILKQKSLSPFITSEETPLKRTVTVEASPQLEYQEIEALLLHRYRRQTEQSIRLPSTIPTEDTWPEGLAKESTQNIQKILIHHANQGHLYAKTLLATHYLSGLFGYDPVRAGMQLRRIKEVIQLNEKGHLWLQHFLDERQVLIDSCDAYQALSTAFSVFAITGKTTPAHEATHVAREGQSFSLRPDVENGYSRIEQNLAGRSILSPAAMGFEADRENELRGHISTILSLLSNIPSPHHHITRSTEYHAIKLTTTDHKALTVYNSWLLYYLGCYLEKKGGVHVKTSDQEFLSGLTTALEKAKISFTSSNGITIKESSGVVFMNAFEISQKCPAALAKFYVQLKKDNLESDTFPTPTRNTLFKMSERLDGGFNAFCNYVSQLDTDTAMVVAETFQVVGFYRDAAAIYRTFAARSVPVACHRLAWLQDQGKVDAPPAEIAREYLCAIRGGYVKAAGRLKTYIDKNPKLMKFSVEALEYLRINTPHCEKAREMLQDLSD